MKRKYWKRGIAVILTVCMLTGTGCASRGSNDNAERNSWEDDSRVQADNDREDTVDENITQQTEPDYSLEALEGAWYIYGWTSIAEQGEAAEPDGCLSFRDNVMTYTPADGSGSEQNGYDYNEATGILTPIVEETEQEELDTEDPLVAEIVDNLTEWYKYFYVEIYDDILILYMSVYRLGDMDDDMDGFDRWKLENTVKSYDGYIFSFCGILSREAVTPNIKSLSCRGGMPTIEGAVTLYYGREPSAYAYGLLQREYQVYDYDANEIGQKMEELIGPVRSVSGWVDSPVTIHMADDIPRTNYVWSYYEDAPISQMKYVIYSVDTDEGTESHSCYVAQTYGFWNVVMTVD